MESLIFSYPLLDLKGSLYSQPVISLADPRLRDRALLRSHVEAVRATSISGVAWGGYLEKRFVYADSPNFMEDGSPRDIHLGIDIFADAGEEIFAPMDGTVHSFQDNFGESNYGPTVILKHNGPKGSFHTLYGHLSRESLEGLRVGMPISGGARLGTLGAAEVNGNWPPHLHFQVILDMGYWQGDYPGACTDADLAEYMANCPDPMDFIE